MTRVAVVTGGTRGIGAGIAKALSEAGYEVAATYQGNDAAAAAFHEETGIAVFKWDVADFAACEKGMAEIVQALGPVEVLVNNAGVTRDVMLHKMTSDQWRAVIDTNLTSCFNLCRLAIEPMRAAGFGRIVNISSINGQKGQMGQSNYSAAKAGIIGFTKALAQETAKKGITVNAVAPGYVNTDMVAAVPENVLQGIIAGIPVGRLGEADDIARAVLFLASDAAGFVTGSTLTVNGGPYIT
ncbi:MAG: acetoacetyl-CoA reductase [Alphaproteobacteria bacterium]